MEGEHQVNWLHQPDQCYQLVEACEMTLHLGAKWRESPIWEPWKAAEGCKTPLVFRVEWEYYYPGRLQHADRQRKPPIYLVMSPLPRFVALCDQNQPTLQTGGRRTDRQTDAMLVASAIHIACRAKKTSVQFYWTTLCKHDKTGYPNGMSPTPGYQADFIQHFSYYYVSIPFCLAITATVVEMIDNRFKWRMENFWDTA